MRIRRLMVMAIVPALVAALFAAPASALTPNDVRTRIDAIQQKIDAGINAGTITPESARVLNFRLGEVRKRLAPGLPPAALGELSGRLDALEPSVPRPMKPRSPEGVIEGQLAQLQAAIGEGETTRTIVPLAGHSLRTELASIRAEFDAALGRGQLTEGEAKRIEFRIGQLADKVRQYGAHRKQYETIKHFK